MWCSASRTRLGRWLPRRRCDSLKNETGKPTRTASELDSIIQLQRTVPKVVRTYERDPIWSIWCSASRTRLGRWLPRRQCHSLKDETGKQTHTASELDSIIQLQRTVPKVVTTYHLPPRRSTGFSASRTRLGRWLPRRQCDSLKMKQGSE